MRKVCPSYTEEEYASLENAAKDYGMTVSGYVKYMSLLHVHKDRSSIGTMQSLIQEMFDNLLEREPGEFVVSTLLGDKWYPLTRSEKMILAKQLKDFVDNNRTEYAKTKRKLDNKTTIYIKL